MKRHGKRGDNRRRGLRIVLWAVGLFWLTQVLGGLVLDYWWIRVRFPWQADVYANLRARARTPEVVFLGSSRFHSDFDCDVLDAALRQDLGERAPRTFKAAVPAGDATVAERMLDDMIRMGRCPKLVVMEVAPGTLARRDHWLNQQAMRILDWRDAAEAFLALCRNGKIMYLFRGRLLPLYTHRYRLCKEAIELAKSLCHPEPARKPSDPPVPTPVLTDPEAPVQSQAILTHMEKSFEYVSQELKNYSIGGMTSHRLERLLERCRSAGIGVILVGVPVSSPYRRAYTPEVDAIFLDYMHGLTQHYGCSYSEWRDAVPDRYFMDEHHVHPTGAVYLSRRFAAGLLIPWWRAFQGYSTF